MYWILASLLALLVFAVLRLRPVKGLETIDRTQLKQQIVDESVLILDVRDPVDYAHSQVSGSMNIYVGRLPYVNKKKLDTQKKLLIVAASTYQLKKAARIMKRSGFSKLSGFVWLCQEETTSLQSCEKCCV